VSMGTSGAPIGWTVRVGGVCVCGVGRNDDARRRFPHLRAWLGKPTSSAPTRRRAPHPAHGAPGHGCSQSFPNVACVPACGSLSGGCMLRVVCRGCHFFFLRVACTGFPCIHRLLPPCALWPTRPPLPPRPAALLGSSKPEVVKKGGAPKAAKDPKAPAQPKATAPTVVAAPAAAPAPVAKPKQKVGVGWLRLPA
jgi:hypothetical protein